MDRSSPPPRPESPSDFGAPLRALLTGALGGGAAAAALEPLAGDASTRRYFRLRFPPGSSPATAVLMKLEPADRGIVAEEVVEAQEGFREIPFLNVRRFLERKGLPVPRLLAADPASGLIVLEDLGDTLLWNAAGGRGEGAREGLYRGAVDLLVRLHVEAGTEDPDCYAFRQRYTEGLFLWELHHFVEYGIEARGAKFPPEAAPRAEAAFRTLAAELAAEPPVFTHRDYHSWNLMVRPEGLWMIDFQDALLGPAAYDLASLLFDRGTQERLGSPRVERLFQGYVAGRERSGRGVGDPERFRRSFDLAALQRQLKVVGRFHYLARVRGKTRYLEYLPPVVAKAREVLERLEDLAPLAEAIRGALPEFR